MSDPPWEQDMIYREAFRRVNKVEPYPYQVRIAQALCAGRNVALRAPTGSGKTKAVLTPFLAPELAWAGRPTRLIYALPLRSLVQQIHAEAQSLLKVAHRDPAEATIQTGEQPDDEFFDRGRIVVTTYDQVLSGLLCAPYGLSKKLRNVNAAATAGALVVFDEFHLMGITTALMTGAAGLRLFRGVTQSVWMTATATDAPSQELGRAIEAVPLTLSDDETGALPVVATTQRMLGFASEPISAEAVKACSTGRTIVIVNIVDRAQNLYRELEEWAGRRGILLRCLHSRFFKADRDERVGELNRLFGPNTHNPAILIATQVVEAGIDISCENLLTELCPMNSLLQRAGRCARFPGEHGVVHVHAFPEGDRSYLPYELNREPDPALALTEAILRERKSWIMSPKLVAEWVEQVHGKRDAAAVDGVGWVRRLGDMRGRVHTSLTLGGISSVSDLIRETDDDQIRTIVADANHLPTSPGERDSLTARRWAIKRVLSVDGPATAWYWDLAADDPCWKDLRTDADLARAFVVCLDPAIAGYSREVGLRLGETGVLVSPDRQPPKRPGYGSELRHEAWTTHTRGVTREIERRLSKDGPGSLADAGFRARYSLAGDGLVRTAGACAVIHDLGKLQKRWQSWARRYQEGRHPGRDWSVALAHTDFNPRDQADRDRSRQAGNRGDHSVGSAWYGQILLGQLVGASPLTIGRLVSACVAAVVGHHGGWIPQVGADWDVDQLVPGWEELVREVSGVTPSPQSVRALSVQPNPRGSLARVLDATMDAQQIEGNFALVMYLTRALRLADQHATAEGGRE